MIAFPEAGSKLFPACYGFLDLLDLKQTSYGEAHGPCWRCGGTDRFVVFLAKGRAWCRQCGWKGDTIQLLIDRDGLTFSEARRRLGFSIDLPSRSALKKQQAQCAKMAAARQAFADWLRGKTTALTDEYRALTVRRDELAVLYRQVDRLTDEAARKVEKALGETYDRLALLEQLLDILTYAKHELEQVRWCREEMERGRAIAA